MTSLSGFHVRSCGICAEYTGTGECCLLPISFHRLFDTRLSSGVGTIRPLVVGIQSELTLIPWIKENAFIMIKLCSTFGHIYTIQKLSGIISMTRSIDIMITLFFMYEWEPINFADNLPLRNLSVIYM